MEVDDATLRQLRDEVLQVIACATHADELHRLEVEHAVELYETEMRAALDSHRFEVQNLQKALESRDLIGQAKGIIMVTMHCTAERAFELLVRQSQAENRKLLEVAREVTERAARHAGGSSPRSRDPTTRC
jgi:hypothetical protein